MTESMDYYAAKTCLRWADLLVINGIDESEKEIFRSIIDILPIAAPSNAGGQFDSFLYDSFTPYVKSMLMLD